jgi:polyisoprenoid-binding protein YceI
MRLPRRFLVAGLAGAAAASMAAAYLVLVLSTVNAPTAASLPARLAGSSTTTSLGPPGAFTGAEGPWVVGPGAGGGFVGYRVREILAFDFVHSPNEAVGRTTEVTGTLDIRGNRLASAEVTARIGPPAGNPNQPIALRSDIDMRDGHLSQFLNLRQHPEVRFELAHPIDFEPPEVGRAVEFRAQGNLTILDNSRPVTFPLQARWAGDAIDIAGQLVIKRSDFGMDIPQLLGFRVAEDITIELQLEFVRPCPGACVPTGSPNPSPGPSTPVNSPPASPDVATIAALPVGWGELAFLGLVSHGASSPSDGEIYSLAGGAALPTRLTDTALVTEAEPAWSPDGNRIAYTR